MPDRIRIIAQLAGQPRTETLWGRDYRVVPAVLVQEQVLHNNLGRTFLAAEDITPEWAEAWNGAPVLVDHPTQRGAPITARDPVVLNELGVGFVFRARAEAAKIKGDVYLDTTRAAEVPDLTAILERLERGEPAELSTGFPVLAEQVQGVHNGEAYDLRLRPMGADHLAIFAEKIGACSVTDGCGLGVNHEGPCDCGAEPADASAAVAASSAEPAEPAKPAEIASIWRRILHWLWPPAKNQSDEDRRRLLQTAVREQFGGDDRFIFVDSVFSDEDPPTVVFEVEVLEGDAEGAGLFRATYEVAEDGTVTLGEPERVRRVTTFEPVANAGDPPQEGQTMNREQMIAQLAARGTDRAALEKLTDAQLQALVNAGGAQPAGGAEPAGDNPTTLREAQALAARYRRELEEAREQSRNALAAEEAERVRLMDDILYEGNSPWSDDEIRAMDINQLRKVHHALIGRRDVDYSGRGGPRGAQVGNFAFVRPILTGNEGESVLDGRKREEVA